MPPSEKASQSIEKDLRPISLTPTLSKLLESYVCSWVMECTKEDMDPHQYGNVKGTSTTHALVTLLDTLHKGLDVSGASARVLLIDFSKAFDHIDHHLLLQKMSSRGVPDFILGWTRGFLCQRQQRVRVSDIFSEWASPNGGVPQGTLSGPLHYQIMANDFTTMLDMLKYVDDSSIYEILQKSQTSKLQLASQQAEDWARNNKIAINATKTQELSIQFNRKSIPPPQVHINDKAIKQVHSAKLLGITLSSDLTWGPHIDDIYGKASRKLHFLRLLKRSGALAQDMVAIYQSSIRSILEYACPVWSTGLTIQQSNQLESVQRRAMRIIYPTMTYNKALDTSNLPTLRERRLQLCKKLFLEMQDPSHKLNTLLPAVHSSAYELRSSPKYPYIKGRTDRYLNSFLPYCVRHCQ